MIKIYLSNCTKDTEHRLGTALAQYALRDSFGIIGSVAHHDNGKPYFPGTPVRVSISHSEGLCLAAVSDTEIGADIEFMKADRTRLIRLAHRFFTAKEALYVEGAPDERFFEIWCAKESYVKYTGEGFSHPFSSFELNECELIFSYFKYGSYMIAICSSKKTETPPIFVASKLLRSE